VKPYAGANHPPVARLGHAARLDAKSGERVSLSAQGSSDPDAQALSYEWFYYPEPGTLALATGRTGAPLAIEGSRTAMASFVAPKVSKAETMHFVVAVTDAGVPALTRYRRVIVTVQP
jgi:hypothetical protein